MTNPTRSWLMSQGRACARGGLVWILVVGAAEIGHAARHDHEFEQRTITVEAVGRYGPDERPADGRTRAIENGRRLALEQVGAAQNIKSADVVVVDSGVDFGRHLVAGLTFVGQTALILSTEVLEDGPGRHEGSGYIYPIRIKFGIAVPPAGTIGSGPRLDVDLNRTRFTPADEMIVTIRCDRDAFVYVFSVAGDFQTVLLVPNPYLPTAKVAAGVEREFPAVEQRRAGIAFRTQLPTGSRAANEYLVVVATERRLETFENRIQPENSGFYELSSDANVDMLRDFYEDLMRTDPSLWAVSQIGFTIEDP